jgi:CRP-like cAMP-binding protein
VLGILTAGDFIDLAIIFNTKESDAYAIALTTVSVVKVEKLEILDAVAYSRVIFSVIKAFF